MGSSRKQWGRGPGRCEFEITDTLTDSLAWYAGKRFKVVPFQNHDTAFLSGDCNVIAFLKPGPLRSPSVLHVIICVLLICTQVIMIQLIAGMRGHCHDEQLCKTANTLLCRTIASCTCSGSSISMIHHSRDHWGLNSRSYLKWLQHST